MATLVGDVVQSELLKRKSTTSEEFLDEKTRDPEKVVEVTERSIAGDDESDVDATVIQKAEDVAVQVN